MAKPTLAVVSSTKKKTRKSDDPDTSSGRVRYPDWLPRTARPVFRLVVMELRGLGVDSQLDHEPIARYAFYVWRWRECSRIIAKSGELEECKTANGKSTKKLRSEVLVAREYENLMVRLEKLLGITPGARARIRRVLGKRRSPGTDLSPTRSKRGRRAAT